MLRIQNNRVIVDNRYVRNMNMRFADSLPQRNTDVNVAVRDGRGEVSIVEQPRRNNDYTAVVSINPRGRSDRFVLDFYWNDSYRSNGSIFDPGYQRDGYHRGDRDGTRSRTRDDGYNRSGNYSGTMTWIGVVDDESLVEIRNNRVRLRNLKGAQPRTDRADFSSLMPNADMNVRLVDARGRGRVELVEQPNARNNYAALVRISDPDGGASNYAFTLEWTSSGNYNGSYDRDGRVFGGNGNYGSTLGAQELMLTGNVDGRVRVVVQGNRYWVETLSGREPSNLRVDFGSPLPRQAVNVDLQQVRGRGNVRLIERPTPSNGYRMVFEINDTSGGQDVYQIRARW